MALILAPGYISNSSSRYRSWFWILVVVLGYGSKSYSGSLFLAMQYYSQEYKEFLPLGSLNPCINLQHIFKKDIFFCSIVGRNWNIISLVVGIQPLSSSIVMNFFVLPYPLGLYLLPEFDAREAIHLLYSLISTLFSWLCGLWGEALGEVTNTLLPNVHSTVVVEKPILPSTRTNLHTHPLHMTLCMLLDCGILLSITLMKSIRPIEHRFILTSGCLIMDFLSTKIICLYIPTIFYGMSSLLTVVTIKKLCV
jgi:hypothetical protein